jgi:hypothetical protein
LVQGEPISATKEMQTFTHHLSEQNHYLLHLGHMQHKVPAAAQITVH